MITVPPAAAQVASTTIEGIENIRRLFKNVLKEWVKLRTEQKVTRGKKTKKLLRLLESDHPPEVRAATAWVLGELGLREPEVGQTLCGLLDDCWPPEKFMLRGIGTLTPTIRAENTWASYVGGRDLVVEAAFAHMARK